LSRLAHSLLSISLYLRPRVHCRHLAIDRHPFAPFLDLYSFRMATFFYTEDRAR
jgi:predicted component of type VI protein secretion system